MARPKSDVERIQTGVRLRPEVIKALKHLCIDLDKPFNVVIEDAAEAYLEQHGYGIPSRQPIATPPRRKKKPIE